MTDGTFDIRPWAGSDLGEVLKLLRDALGETPLLRRTDELFSWKHLENPFGRSIMFVATDGGTIIGFRAFMRWELRTPTGDTVRCVRAVDTATHPDFLRRGVFAALTTEAVAEAMRSGVDLIFNTPNPRSGAGYLKLGWQHVGDIHPLATPARGLLRGKGRVDAPPDRSDFLSRYTAVADRTVPDRQATGLRTPRSADYHRWRFLSHPTARYAQIDAEDGTAIVRPGFRGTRRELLISELFGDHPRKAISATRRSARASYVGAYFPEGSTERTALKRSGFLRVPNAKLTLMARPLTQLDLDVTDLASWDVALSDLELL